VNKPGDKPFWARCINPDCFHCWPAAYAPMEMALFAEVVSANARYCPKCGTGKPVIAKQTDGVLEEPQNPLT
jgi:hypothetical protein